MPRRYSGYREDRDVARGVLLIIALTCSACTSLDWHRPNSTHQDLAGDQADCQAFVDSGLRRASLDNEFGLGLSISTMGIGTRFYTNPGDSSVDNCLNQMGWTLAPR
ncbi:hypothetical protein A5892_11620 [Halotalea alkalilenta]|uniref:Uncharacterized protein n=1 Tax=Halotalea alkalilenta TaxID=376489 RepID=A0A172YG38_9GAMM|nr:hypothetical protein A5892_11620 [Halotalea alkalilenta]